MTAHPHISPRSRRAAAGSSSSPARPVGPSASAGLEPTAAGGGRPPAPGRGATLVDFHAERALGEPAWPERGLARDLRRERLQDLNERGRSGDLSAASGIALAVGLGGLFWLAAAAAVTRWLAS